MRKDSATRYNLSSYFGETLRNPEVQVWEETCYIPLVVADCHVSNILSLLLYFALCFTFIILITHLYTCMISCVLCYVVCSRFDREQEGLCGSCKIFKDGEI